MISQNSACTSHGQLALTASTQKVATQSASLPRDSLCLPPSLIYCGEANSEDSLLVTSPQTRILLLSATQYPAFPTCAIVFAVVSSPYSSQHRALSHRVTSDSLTVVRGGGGEGVGGRKGNGVTRDLVQHCTPAQLVIIRLVHNAPPSISSTCFNPFARVKPLKKEQKDHYWSTIIPWYSPPPSPYCISNFTIIPCSPSLISEFTFPLTSGPTADAGKI